MYRNQFLFAFLLLGEATLSSARVEISDFTPSECLKSILRRTQYSRQAILYSYIYIYVFACIFIFYFYIYIYMYNIPWDLK